MGMCFATGLVWMTVVEAVEESGALAYDEYVASAVEGSVAGSEVVCETAE